jgi:hypothetical protein
MYIVCIDNVVRESNKRTVFSYINYLIDNDMLGNHGEKGITANGCYEDVLTIGKTYYCTGKMMGDTLIGVIDDKGNQHYLPKDLFITVEENRDRKIKRY